MIYFLGLAKSSIDLNGAKAQKLELDLLRLIYLIKTTKTKTIFGFLMVYDDKIIKRCIGWLKKYNAYSLIDNKIFIYKFSNEITNEQMIVLRNEKENNKKGNTRKKSKLSKADFGKETIEELLHQKMFLEISKEGYQISINEIIKDKIVFKISWDGVYSI